MNSNTHKIPKTEELKRRLKIGTQGTPILMHRALRSLPLTYTSVLAILLLPIIFDVALWMNLEHILSFWEHIFHFWATKMAMNGQVLFLDADFMGIHKLYIPFPNLPVVIPSFTAVWVNVLLCFAVFLLSLLISESYLPFTYLLRAALMIQVSASVYFFFHPHSFPYEIGDYVASELVMGLYLLFLVPPILALLYYIFDFPIASKILVTGMIISYFIVLLPFQYMLHAVIISSGSLLFMPMLYLLFGLLVETLMFVSWYAWAMSWR